MSFNSNDNLQQQISQLQDSMGIVVDVNDPLKLRRVRCKIQGIIEPEDISLLPWCTPKGSGTGGRADYGEFSVPELYSKVKISFPNKEVRSPVYEAIGDDATDNSQIKLFGEDYPTTEGKSDSTGSWTRTNKTQRYEEHLHNSGFYHQVDKDGNLHVFIPKSVIIHIGENLQVKVDKDVGIHALQNLGIIADKDVGYKAGGSLEIISTEGTWEAPTMIDLNTGVIFGTADAIKEAIEEPVNSVNERQATVVSLQQEILDAGKFTIEALKTSAKGLVGTGGS